MTFTRNSLTVAVAALMLCGGPLSARNWKDVFVNSHGVPQPQHRVDFLKHLRDTYDPQGKSFVNAAFNTDENIGVIVSPGMTADAIQAMLRTFATEMSMSFPGRNLAVTALAPGDPPKEIGTTFFFTDTNEALYQPAHPKLHRKQKGPHDVNP
jgi:hypothetical protein